MDAIDTLLSRGVDSVYPSREELAKVLRAGKKLTLYQGFDPTGTQLHIGHAVAIRKLRQFQDLGHRVIFLIGDGTGQAGDPSGKSTSRDKFYTREELRANARDYVRQAGQIVRFKGDNPVEIRYNSDWLNKLTLVDILGIAQHFSVQQLIERDMYRERMKREESINLREFLYPLLQGYDSVAMKVDLELGGTDQTFNMLAGRTLVKAMLGKEKFVMTVPLLTDARGTKIGKTEGNVIAITDPPGELYAKIMNLGDDAIINCFMLLTDLREDDIRTMEGEMQGGINPMQYKKKLAFELTRTFHDAAAAGRAETEFESVHQKGGLPAEAGYVFESRERSADPVEILVGSGATASRSEAKRLIDQNAVETGGVILKAGTPLRIGKGVIIKVGKKKFISIKTI
ncbi:tyrosine--tRNA ligase [Candidatus Gottesmanbacteria bacterium RBG_16_52_11]|uniref:Tyrosine--tRNA ligase n=1 Tax=Candidatus Gottesmanbacteria bacterium RBG_16_52_11 TaxID=1798374 RepID=A0A1F5YNP4_9BACT|nr:MAG: tyrosine--tRNA ligase [Candidatus Gottesmanbacteria bacterium RBG_16_52_11]